jgi:membrane protein
MTWMMLLYRVAPETSKKWRPFTPGAIFSMIALGIANVGLGLYFGFSAKSQTVTYGALAGFIALLLYLYVVSSIVLIGAEVNAVLEQARKGKPDEPARERVPGREPARPRPGRLVESTP